jgi:cytochrome P450
MISARQRSKSFTPPPIYAEELAAKPAVRKERVMNMLATQPEHATRTANFQTPISDTDPYSDAALMEPWNMYRELQDLGSAVWLTRHQMFALTRYDSVRRALQDARAFSSASGVMMNDDMNRVLRGNTLCSDGVEHRHLRRLIMKPLTPTALDSLKAEITTKADRLVDRLVTRRRFCAVAELAAALPVDIVASAVGLPQEGRERMLVWAEQMFNCFGPLNDRSRSAFPILDEMMHYATTQAVRGKLKPGSWSEAIVEAMDRGEIDEEVRPVLMIDYMGPSLDTTIHAIANGVWLFAKHPAEWQKVREDPACVAPALNEILRMEAPVQGFSRLVTQDCDMDGITLPAGARVIAFYGAANRDERKFPSPNVFDARRGSSDHLAFGWGPHACVGQHLAKLEMTAIFRALAMRVTRFRLEEEIRSVNNILRGFSKLMVSVE